MMILIRLKNVSIPCMNTTNYTYDNALATNDDRCM
jgi:hypothetical protein